jgi:large subunit ribosomal protein L23
LRSTAANKHQIREALQLFGVTAVRCARWWSEGSGAGPYLGLTARWKKAVVTLKEGETLPVFEG